MPNALAVATSSRVSPISSSLSAGPVPARWRATPIRTTPAAGSDLAPDHALPISRPPAPVQRAQCPLDPVDVADEGLRAGALSELPATRAAATDDDLLLRLGLDEDGRADNFVVELVDLGGD